MKPEREPAMDGEVFVLSLATSAVTISGSFVVSAGIARISHLGSPFAAVLVVVTATAVAFPISLTMPRIAGSLVRRFREYARN